MLWLKINALTLSILGTRDMTFANIIVGSLDAHADLVTRVVLVLSITVLFFVLTLKVSSLKCIQTQQGQHIKIETIRDKITIVCNMPNAYRSSDECQQTVRSY